MSQNDIKLATITVLTSLALAAGPTRLCLATPVWFDETGSGGGYADFEALADDYSVFFDAPSTTLSFDDLAIGDVLADQYSASAGLTFLNATGVGRGANSGIFAEGDRAIGDLTGYDGSFRPDADPVLVTFGNDDPSKPLTLLFDEPVVGVGAFVAVGRQGRDHTLTVSVFDRFDALLAEHTVNTFLWESRPGGQNYESFFAVRSQAPDIARVEIRNNAGGKSGNVLIVDDLALLHRDDRFPEPTTGLLLSVGVIGLLLRRGRSCRV